jgi:hypothetical protein
MFRHLFTISMILALTLVAIVPASAASVSVIDFEGLAEGAIVSSVAYGAGISGDPVSGSVSVYGHNPVFAGTNAAMIFDAACPGGCSGQDQDLFNAAQGKVLIVSEDLDQTDPDDSDSPGQNFRFNFSGFATVW